MFPEWVQARARRVAEGIVTPLARLGVTPNIITVVGFLLNCVTAGVLASGHLSIGGGLLFFSGMFDMLDGALARVMSQQSDFGAFLDSILDRYSEAAILLALIYQFTMATPARPVPVLLVYAVAIGSLVISYARARAEGLGLEAKIGIAPRPERVLILGLGLLFNATTTIFALVVLTFITHFTAMQRLYAVWRQTRVKATTEPKPSRVKAPETGAT